MSTITRPSENASISTFRRTVLILSACALAIAGVGAYGEFELRKALRKSDEVATVYREILRRQTECMNRKHPELKADTFFVDALNGARHSSTPIRLDSQKCLIEATDNFLKEYPNK